MLKVQLTEDTKEQLSGIVNILIQATGDTKGRAVKGLQDLSRDIKDSSGDTLIFSSLESMTAFRAILCLAEEGNDD